MYKAGEQKNRVYEVPCAGKNNALEGCEAGGSGMDEVESQAAGKKPTHSRCQISLDRGNILPFEVY